MLSNPCAIDASFIVKEILWRLDTMSHDSKEICGNDMVICSIYGSRKQGSLFCLSLRTVWRAGQYWRKIKRKQRTEGKRSRYSIRLLFLDQFRCINKLPSVDHDHSSRKSTGHSPEQHICQGLRPSVTWQRVSLLTN